MLTALLPSLSSPLFTADLRHHSSAGAYTFGRVDGARYKAGTAIRYTALAPNATFWQFPYRGVRVRGDEAWHPSNGTAIADTGTTLLLLSRQAAELYYAAVPGAGRNRTVGGVWTYPCDLDASRASASASASAGGGDGENKRRNEVKKMPDFQVGFENDFVATVPGRFMNYTVMPDDAAMCMGGLQEWGNDDLGIFGDIFLKAVYAVFDVGGGRIGFAEKELEVE